MSLDVDIIYKKRKSDNYFISHPYIYNNLSDNDLNNFNESSYWNGNITHNLGKMASHIPVADTNLYQVCWRPEEQDWHTTDEILPMLVEGIKYMIEHRKELLQYNSPNGWGTYSAFLKFLLNYKEACEDNPGCEIEVSR